MPENAVGCLRAASSVSSSDMQAKRKRHVSALLLLGVGVGFFPAC